MSTPPSSKHTEVDLPVDPFLESKSDLSVDEASAEMSEPDKLSRVNIPPESQCQLVTVYRLTEKDNWDYDGMGNIAVDNFEGTKDLGIFIIDHNEAIILSHCICPNDIYRLQEENFIFLKENSTELALSFQEKTCCTYIWKSICDQQAMQKRTHDSKSLLESESQLVTVYRLNEKGGNWDYIGIGHVTVDNLEGTKDLGIFVIDHKEAIILSHVICPDDIYRKQEEKVISWTEDSTKSSLSFQEKTCCTYIWESICDQQKAIKIRTSACDPTPPPKTPPPCDQQKAIQITTSACDPTPPPKTPPPKGRPAFILALQWPFTFFMKMKAEGKAKGIIVETPDAEQKYGVHFLHPKDQSNSRPQTLPTNEKLWFDLLEWKLMPAMKQMWPYYGTETDHGFWFHVLKEHCEYSYVTPEDYFRKGIQAAKKLDDGGFFPVLHGFPESPLRFRLPPGIYKKSDIDKAFNDIKVLITTKEFDGKRYLSEFKVSLDSYLDVCPGKGRVVGRIDPSASIILCSSL